MSKEEIFLKAYQIAEKNGYMPPIDFQVEGGIRGYKFDMSTFIQWFPRIIFSHEFAKAFFGEKQCLGSLQANLVNWKYQLQQMVISDDPLKYLAQFLPKED